VRRRDLIAGTTAVLLAAGCIWLGFWQLDRRHQRRARNAELLARLSLPPIDVSKGTRADSVRQRRVRARGAFDYVREQVWPGRSFEGTPGVALVTPLRLADGSAVLVDRGWAPSPDAFHVEHARFRETDSMVVDGIGLPVPRGRGDVSTAGYLPFVIQQLEPAAARGLPRRWPAPAMDEGPHLAYAIQWFSFAVIVLAGTAALLRPRSRSSGRAGPAE
jgi:surfeit locus 1 family protein